MMQRCRGFTLIELSIVLIIIGLISATIVTGSLLITAATIRDQVSQIEQYDAAANTFHAKYGFLPGDLPPDQADQLQFGPRGGGVGDGNGDGRISGKGTPPGYADILLGGETVLFWTDLTSAKLIDGTFTDTSDALVNGVGENAITPYLPKARMRRDSNFIVFSTGDFHGMLQATPDTHYQIFAFKQFAPFGPPMITNGGITVQGGALKTAEAASIDVKMDDGMPFTGRVQAAWPPEGVEVPLNYTLYNALTIDSTDPSWTPCIKVIGTEYYYNNANPNETEKLNCSLRIKAGF